MAMEKNEPSNPSRVSFLVWFCLVLNDSSMDGDPSWILIDAWMETALNHSMIPPSFTPIDHPAKPSVHLSWRWCEQNNKKSTKKEGGNIPKIQKRKKKKPNNPTIGYGCVWRFIWRWPSKRSFRWDCHLSTAVVTNDRRWPSIGAECH